MDDRSTDQHRENLLCLIEPIVYGDIFDSPLTLEELHRFCTLPLSLEELRSEIKGNGDFNRLVSRSGAYFFLEGKERLVDVRERRNVVSRRSWKRAQRVVRIIKYVPFVKGIMVTGSLAMNNTKGQDDLDFLVLTGANRLWSVFFVLGTLQRLFSRRYLCPNYYVSTDHFCLPEKSYYIAREVIQAKPIYGTVHCRRFFEENRWVFDLFPNLEGAEDVTSAENQLGERKGITSWVSSAIEWFLGGKLGDVIESICKTLLKHRLHVHYRQHDRTVPNDIMYNALNGIELKFHALNREVLINQEIATRKRSIVARIDGEYE
jgi:hypothetical protein